VRIGDRAFEGRAAVVADPADADDGAARAAIAGKYGTTGLTTWLRTALPVAIQLERELGPEDGGDAGGVAGEPSDLAFGRRVDPNSST